MDAIISEALVGNDYQNQFYNALWMGLMRNFWAMLTHQQTRLLDLGEYMTTIKNGSFQGQREVKIDDILGSESGRLEFDDKFYPLTDRTRQRWQSIARAMNKGLGLPPVELVQVGKVFFVRDGHHRISVARALGWKTISALVMVWNS